MAELTPSSCLNGRTDPVFVNGRTDPVFAATLTHSDIENHAISKGSSVGVSGGFSVAGKQTEENKNLMNVGGKKDSQTASLPVIVALSDNSSSTTRSGISGGAVVITDDAAQRAATGKGAEDSIAGLNRDVTTGVDSSGKIGNNFDKSKLQATMDATAAFAAAAAKGVGDYAQDKLKEAAELARQAEEAGEANDFVKQAELQQQSKDLTDNWKEGGLARAALHAAVGALGGGASGALGAGAAALSTDAIAKQLKTLDIPETLRSALTLAAGAAVGAVAGGATGAASATNEVANNYLKHEEIVKLIDLETACKNHPGGSDCDARDQLQVKSVARDTALAICYGDSSNECENLRHQARMDTNEISEKGDGYLGSKIYKDESDKAFDRAFLDYADGKPVGASKNIFDVVPSISIVARNPNTLNSAFLDTGKAAINFTFNIFEFGVNFVGGELPGSPDYYAFMNNYRAEYDTPSFGKTSEFLLSFGAGGGSVKEALINSLS
ncbi:MULTISPECIES: DUF6862 domain-containing protein [unclassified Janthinobacterium]|uniref:DUF6862 domain-containing protein n=1 Tax=unclassified Janthinobacterium TaxID=2610881 RepID=UPI001619E6AA|nr:MULTISPECIES: hypothetical protein [unclassified Janthinobacterium]MBB5610984.1 hypothetical protein [Janthinobacterium sp. S3T4]MBB5616479.1 hypothetical protein [Janthinobacterium sp. S3M3]